MWMYIYLGFKAIQSCIVLSELKCHHIFSIYIYQRISAKHTIQLSIENIIADAIVERCYLKTKMLGVYFNTRIGLYRSFVLQILITMFVSIRSLMCTITR